MVACQVRRRDSNSKKVLVEERRYEHIVEDATDADVTPGPGSSSSSHVDTAYVEGESPSSSSSTTSFGSTFSQDDDPFAWAQRLRDVPDKVCTEMTRYPSLMQKEIMKDQYLNVGVSLELCRTP